jgi:hypothetical protein
MSREVIQDFLNSAGVVGIALTNRRMRPYFFGLDNVLDRTKQALGQGVLQVVENVPEGFESFEFYFAGHVVFIYKLTHGLVLLVLTNKELELADYKQSLTKIKYLIETDTYNTVAHFKLLLGSVTQHSLPNPNWNVGQAQAASLTKPQIPTSITATSTIATSTEATSTKAPLAKAVTTNNSIKTTNISNKSVSTKTDTQEYKLDELLAALNKLSNFTTQYLGKVVVTNYWKSTRTADLSWLAEFEVDRNGQISHPKQIAIACTPAQHQQIQLWVAAYIKRCKQVIRNFDQMLAQDCLDNRQKQMLLRRD